MQLLITRSAPLQQDVTFSSDGGMETAHTVPFKPERSRLGIPAQGTVGVLVDVGTGMAEEFIFERCQTTEIDVALLRSKTDKRAGDGRSVGSSRFAIIPSYGCFGEPRQIA